MKKLFLIPARGGSKGLPRKNILPLAGRPMIEYTLDAAIGAMEDGDELCVSTDDSEIIQVVENYGVKVPFVRPAELASDSTSTHEVIEHALSWYEDRGHSFDVVALLQVTSPLRNASHVKDALGLYNENLDLVTSVKITDSNPYYVLYEENNIGLLEKSKVGMFTRRQDCPKVFELTGAIYIVNAKSIKKIKLSDLNKIKKYVMSKVNSIDIDDELDYIVAQNYLKKL